MKRFAILAAGVLGLCAIVFADNALLINRSGCNVPGIPSYSKWFDVYHTKNPNFQFNYQSVGSGAGIKQVTEGTVDFGATDGPMNDEQLKAFQDKHNGTGILHFPTVLGADVPTYNIPGVTSGVEFHAGSAGGNFSRESDEVERSSHCRAEQGRQSSGRGHHRRASLRWQRHNVYLDRLSLQGSADEWKTRGWQGTFHQLAQRASAAREMRSHRQRQDTPNTIGYVELI